MCSASSTKSLDIIQQSNSSLSFHMCLAPFYLALEHILNSQQVKNAIIIFFVFPLCNTCNIVALSLCLVSEAVWQKYWDFPKSGYNFQSAKVRCNQYYLILGSRDPQACVLYNLVIVTFYLPCSIGSDTQPMTTASSTNKPLLMLTIWPLVKCDTFNIYIHSEISAIFYFVSN